MQIEIFPSTTCNLKRSCTFERCGQTQGGQAALFNGLRSRTTQREKFSFLPSPARHFSTTSEQHWPSVRTAASSGERPLAKKALTGRMADLQAEVEQVIWRQNRLGRRENRTGFGHSISTQPRARRAVPVDLRRRDETRLRRIRSAFDRGDCVSSEPDGCCSAEECTTFLAVGWASGWLVNADLTGRRVCVCDGAVGWLPVAGMMSTAGSNGEAIGEEAIGVVGELTVVEGLPAIKSQPATPATTRNASVAREATRRWRRPDRRLSGLPGLPTSTK